MNSLQLAKYIIFSTYVHVCKYLQKIRFLEINNSETYKCSMYCSLCGRSINKQMLTNKQTSFSVFKNMYVHIRILYTCVDTTCTYIDTTDTCVDTTCTYIDTTDTCVDTTYIYGLRSHDKCESMSERKDLCLEGGLL